MRAVGAQTQAQLDSGVISRAIRVSVYDEAGMEVPINPDLLVGFPVVKGDLDSISWRMDVAIRVDETTAGVLVRGRTIQAWDVFAQGEDLELFKGKIVDLRIPQDYSSGVEKVIAQVVAVGVAAERLEGTLTRYAWEPTLYNPIASNTHVPAWTDLQRLTAILKTYRLTLTWSAPTVTGAINGALTYNGDGSTNIPLVSAAGLAQGNVVYLIKASTDRKCHRATIKSIAGSTVTVNEAIPVGRYVAGDVLLLGGLTAIPVNMAYYGTTTLESHVTVYNETGSTTTSFQYFIEQFTGAPMIRFTISPGGRFTIDIMAVDRWVLLKGQKYNGSLIVPYFYLLEGIAGQPGSERLNDLAKTAVKASPVPSNSTIYVDDPSGIFASTTGWDRWASIWIGGVEYRGKVSSVDKTIGSGTYGQVVFHASYPLRSAAGTLAAPVGGETAGNSSTTHYEILSPHVRANVWSDLGGGSWQFNGQILHHEPRGGWLMLGYKKASMITVIPDYDPGLFSWPGLWKYALAAQQIVVESAETNASNDASSCLSALLQLSGYSGGDLALDASGYTLAPFARANTRIGELVDQLRRDTIPPNYRLLETEGGGVVGRYISQKPTADLVLRGVKKFSPRELPRRLTRVVVKGKQIETNRAGQLYYTVDGIRDINRLFDGYSEQSDYGMTSAITTIATARAVFRIPRCEPGRWPIVSKVVLAASSELSAEVGATPSWGKATIIADISSMPAMTAQVDNISGFYLGQKVVVFSNASPGFTENRTIAGIAGSSAPYTITFDRSLSAFHSAASKDYLIPETRSFPLPLTPNNMGETFTKTEYSGSFETILGGRTEPEGECMLVAWFLANDGATTDLYVDEIEVWIKEGAYWEARFVDGGGSTFGSSWSQPDRTLSLSQRTAPTAWLKNNMADYAKGVDRIVVIDADGITVAQARELAEATLDWSIRSSEFFDVEADYDPRAQRGDTVSDASGRLYTVWSIEKYETTMKLALADFSRV